MTSIASYSGVLLAHRKVGRSSEALAECESFDGEPLAEARGAAIASSIT